MGENRKFSNFGLSQGSGGEIIFNNGLVLPPAITVAISSSQNNLSIPTLSTECLIRFNNTGTNNLTGLIPSDITQGNLIFIANIGTGQLTIVDNSASSTAQNRFLCGGSKNLQTDEGMILVYDTVSLRWRAFAVIL